MADKRINDWTDAMRERLSSSELAPSSDIWSKVESAAAEVPGSRRTLPKPFWWAAGCVAAAALAAIIILPQGGSNGSLQVDPHPQTVMAQSLSSQDTPAQPSLQTPSASSASPASAQRQYRPSSVPPAESFDDTVMPEAATEMQPAASDSLSSQVDGENGQASDRISDAAANPSRPVYRMPVEDKLFESIPDESSERKKELTASLFASGIPGASGTDGKYQYSTTTLVNDGTYGFGCLISSLGPDSPTISEAFEPEYYQTNGIVKNIHHHRPVSIGLALSYPLTDRWFLESGLMYSYLRSEYDLPSGSPMWYEIDGKRFESSVLDGHQRLHFIGIPLKAGYRFTTPSRFSVSLSAGAMAERCVHGEWLGNKVSVGGTQFSAVASASARYRMADRVSLFLSPEWSYYFTETDLPTYHTDTPVSMTLRLGLTLDLGNISLPGK